MVLYLPPIFGRFRGLSLAIAPPVPIRTARRTMDNRYKLYRRGKRLYAEERGTGKRRSLKTTDREQALQMLAAMNGRADLAALSRHLAEIHLSFSDERALDRTWADVMDRFGAVGTSATQERKRRAFAAPCFGQLRTKVVIATPYEDFDDIIALGKILDRGCVDRRSPPPS